MPQPAVPSNTDTTTDATLSAAFDRLGDTSQVASTEDGAAPTGFEGEDFETGTKGGTAQPSPLDDAMTAAIAAAAAAEASATIERAAADEHFRIEPLAPAAAQPDPTAEPAANLLVAAEAMFARRPLGRNRR